jgi:hypothetical protein
MIVTSRDGEGSIANHNLGSVVRFDCQREFNSAARELGDEIDLSVTSAVASAQQIGSSQFNSDFGGGSVHGLVFLDVGERN